MRLLRIVLLVAALAAALLSASGARAQDTGAAVDLVQIKGLIEPVQAGYLDDRLSEDPGRQAVILEIDSPGALDPDLDGLLESMEDAGVPVVCWIAPRGAEAASTAVYLAAACDLTYMSDDATIGPALPVHLGVAPGDFESEAAALLERAAGVGGRTGYPAADVLDGTFTATEAVDSGVVDGAVSTLDALLAEIDGTTIDGVTLETFDEATGSLSAPVRFQGMGAWDRVLHTVVSPELAFFLLLAGVFGLIFEVYNPGIGLAGGLGAASLGLSLYGLDSLPVNWFGVLLIVLGIVSLLIDLQIGGLGLFTVGGGIAVAAGAAVAFDAPTPELQLGVWAIVAGLVFTAVFFISVMTAALRVRLRRPVTEDDKVVGMIAEAKTDIAPEGTVLSKGQLWRARTMETGIAQGSKVKVMATEGSVLLVEPLHEDSGH